MRLQLVLKSGNEEVMRVKGRIEVSNAQLMKVIQCENLIEELTGFRAHILPADNAPIITAADEEQEEFGFTEDE